MGTTTTPFDMVMLNDLDRFHLVMDVIDRVPGLGSKPPGCARRWSMPGSGRVTTRASTGRTHRRSGRRNPGLLAALALSALAQIAAVAIEPLRLLLGTQPLTLTQLGVCLLVAALPAAGLVWARKA